MIIRIFISLLIKLFLDLPMVILGLFIVPVMLILKIDMSKTPWGNRDHPDNGGDFWHRKCGSSFWCAYQWFALRNPTFNFSKYGLLGFVSSGISSRIKGTHEDIGDLDGKSGWYYALDGWRWEFYLVQQYKSSPNKCLRFRCGWKIDGKEKGEYCQFCFSISPWKNYNA